MKIFGYDINIENKDRKRAIQLEQDNKALKEKISDLDYRVSNMSMALKERGGVSKGGGGLLGVDKYNNIYQTYYRRWTSEEFRTALMNATRPDSLIPIWYSLFQIFNNMVLDTHINAMYETLVNAISGQRYSIVDGEEIDEEATDFIKKEWFTDFCKNVVIAHLYGFNLIQIDQYNPIKEDLKISQVNPFFVRPDLNGIVYNPYDTHPTEYNGKPAVWTKSPIQEFTCFIYFDRVGKLAHLFKSYIMKQNALGSWNSYCQRYGIPPLLMKYPDGEEKSIEILKRAAAVFNSDNALITPKSVEVTIETLGANAGNESIFMTMIDNANKEMSKAILGSTMVLEDGASLSQSEVHENNTKKIINGIRNKMIGIMNNDFLEKLHKIGCPIPKGAKIIEEKINDIPEDIKGQAILSVLNNPSFGLTADEIERITGIKTAGHVTTTEVDNNKEYEDLLINKKF